MFFLAAETAPPSKNHKNSSTTSWVTSKIRTLLLYRSGKIPLKIADFSPWSGSSNELLLFTYHVCPKNLIKCYENFLKLSCGQAGVWQTETKTAWHWDDVWREWRASWVSRRCLTAERVGVTVAGDLPQSYLLHCTLASCGAVYCNRSCLWVCNGRAGGVRTLLQPASAVFASLWALFSLCMRLALWSRCAAPG